MLISKRQIVPRVYIYVGKNRENAAGIKVLHLLYSALKENRADVKIVTHTFRLPFTRRVDGSIGRWEMAKDIIAMRKIVMIYPESIGLNLLGIGTPAYYLLSLPNELQSPRFNKKFLGNTFSYSKSIAKSWHSLGPVIHLPTIQINELESYRSPKKISDVVYGGKFIDLYRKSIPLELKKYLVLTRNTHEFPRAKFLSYVSASETLHCFENTAVALEAIFMGTKVQFHFNENFESLILDDEIGGVSVTGNIGMINDPVRSRNAYLTYIQNNRTVDELISFFRQIYNSNIRSTRPRVVQLFFIFPNLRWFIHNVLFLFKALSRENRK